MKQKLIGLGGGGHAKVVIEIIQMRKEHKIIGLLDPKPELLEKKVMGIPVLGSDDLLPTIKEKGIGHFFIGVGSIANTEPRQRLFKSAVGNGLKPVNAIHPQTIISSSVKLDNSITIMAGAVINADVKIGQNVIINTCAVVEHDCIIEDHVHIATGAKLASTVHVGEGSHIGAGATIIQCIHIGKNCVIGAGAVVIRDVPSNSTAIGSPAKIKHF